jgi:hypothetical protein
LDEPAIDSTGDGLSITFDSPTKEPTVVEPGREPASVPVSPTRSHAPRSHRFLPWLLWLSFVVVASGTYVSWEIQGLYAVVGDEPHYLVMADGIAHDWTFEQRAAYEREFVDQVIYPGGLSPDGVVATPANTHAIAGPNGLYNVHNVGLPLLLAGPWVLGGEAGVKLGLVALVSLVVPLTWRFSGRFSSNLSVRVLSTVAATFALPFLLGANQIYPDLPAGILTLVALDRVFALHDRAGRARVGPDRPRWRHRVDDAVAVAVVLYLPWLQMKFSAAAVVLAVALAMSWRRAGHRWAGLAVRLAPVALSLGLLAAYNAHAFGSASGPYTDRPSLEISLHALTVLLGLHLDRFQGLLIQNLACFAGLLFAVPFVRRAWLPGLTVFAVYASFVIPNGLHPVWYGGTSFAGRFMWSGAVAVLPAVVYGLVRLAELSRTWWLALIGSSLLATAITWSGLLIGPGDLFNRPLEMAYPSISPIDGRFLPAFTDPGQAFSYLPNLPFVALALGLVALGALIPIRAGDGGAGRRIVLVLSGLVGAWAVAVMAAGLVDEYELEPVELAGAELPGQVGRIEQDQRIATGDDGPGFVSYGPFLGLRLDRYDYEMVLAGQRDDGAPIGVVDVYSTETATIIDSIEVPSSDDPAGTVVRGRIEVPDELHNNLLEIRAFFHGEGWMAVRRLELDRAP